MNGSTCRAAPRLKWDSGGSLQRPRHVEQPAPRERTQIPVATQVFVDGRPMCTRHDHLLSELTLESNAKSKNHHIAVKRRQFITALQFGS